MSMFSTYLTTTVPAAGLIRRRKAASVAAALVLPVALAAAAPAEASPAHASAYRVTTIRVGAGPAGIAVNPKTDKVYVGNAKCGGELCMSVIDGATNKATFIAGVDADPVAVAADPSTNKAYAADETSNKVSVFDGHSVLNVPALAPNGVAVDPDTERNSYYVSDSKRVVSGQGAFGRVQVFNKFTNAIAHSGILFPGVAEAVALNANTDTIYATSTAGLWVFSGLPGYKQIANIPFPGTSPAVAVNPRTNRVYVLNSLKSSNVVRVISGTTNETTATIRVGKNAQAIAVNPNTNRIYVADTGADNLAVINGSTNKVTSIIPVGHSPDGVAVNPRTNTVYVSNRSDNTVSVITP